MSDQTIRNNVKALLEEVAGIGMVHTFQRYVDDEADLKALFQKDAASPLHGWEITRDGVPTLTRVGSKRIVTHSYLLLGHYAVSDAKQSEILFNLVVDAIVQKFIDKELPDVEFHPVPTVQRITHWMFAGILCHRAELKLSVAEVWVPTPSEDSDLLKLLLTAYLAENDKIKDTSEITP